jgi:hypothetical protein
MKRVFVFAACALFLFSACGKPKDTTPSKPEDKGIAKEWKSGPLTFRLTADKSEMTIADKLSLTLEAVIDKKYQVKLPDLGDKLDEFSIKDFSKNTPKLADKNTMSWKQSYVLEPFLSGEYTIPAFTVKFWAENENQSDPHVLESEPVKIKVDSILPENMKDLKVADEIGPLVPPPPDMTWLFILIGAIVVVGGGIGTLVFLYIKKREGEIKIATIPAHELAYRQLRRLVAENLLDKGEFRLFYFRISDILRHYIENRFRLDAPEKTTEEFLDALKGWAVFGNEQKRLLKLFLVHCDLVKFARHTPTNEDIQMTFDALKQFIHETENAEARIEDLGSEDSDNTVTVEGL